MIYYAYIYRFGYDLICIGRTEEEARDNLLKAYEEHYEDINGISPKKDMFDEEQSYYEVAKDELYIEALDFGGVLFR